MKAKFSFGLFGVIALSACSDRVLTEGLEEPFVVHDAQFVSGELPGSRPLTIEEIIAEVPPRRPAATAPSTETLRLSTGLAGTSFSGLVTDDAVSISIGIDGENSGYWVLPAGAPDPTRAGYLGYSFVADFSHFLPPGRHDLRVAAIDENGESGSQASSSICVNSPVPDNGNACDPEAAPPDLVVSLSWDAPVDLDLVVVTPTDKVVDSRNPTTAEPNDRGQIDPTAAGTGNLEFDSNQDCVLDGKQRENLVFRTLPRGGKFLIYANLDRACDQHSVRYQVTFHTRIPGEEPGTYGVKTSVRGVGTLIEDQANGGTRRGTYVTDLVIGQ